MSDIIDTIATPIHFQPGDEVIVTDDHLLPSYRGDSGKVEILVGFEKYYVRLKKHGRTMVHEKHLKLKNDSEELNVK